MKKVLLLAIIFGGALAFTSCGSKECECTFNGTTTTISEDEANEYGFEGDFEEACNASEGCKTV